MSQHTNILKIVTAVCVGIVIVGLAGVSFVAVARRVFELELEVGRIGDKVAQIEKRRELGQSYNDIFDQRLVMVRIRNLLAKQDSRFKQVSEEDVSNWPLFVHPDGIYSIRYHPQFNPVVSKIGDSEFVYPYARVDFVPRKAGNILSGCQECPPLPSEEPLDFKIGISFDAGGGGSLCANSSCYPVLEYIESLPKIDIEAFETFGGGEERLRAYHSDYIEFGLVFEPAENSKYIGRIYTDYNSYAHRETLRLMLSTLRITPERFERIYK